MRQTPIDFDDYAGIYRELLNSSIGLSGESADYFNLYKLNSLRRWLPGVDRFKLILDYGCGTGELASLTAKAFPKASVYGYDISSKSIGVAQEKWRNLKNLCFSNELPSQIDFDLIIAANVFHHIPPQDHRERVFLLKGMTAQEGQIAVFEHNPLNILTQHTVKNCAFDADAKLILLSSFVRLAEACGLNVYFKRYIVFFPRFLRCLRWLEPHLGSLPIGAQYMLVLGKNG